MGAVETFWRGMSWVEPKYTKSVTDKAGKELSASAFPAATALEVIANFRASHNYPLNIIQDGLRKRARTITSNVLIAQRMKRLSSITAKLTRFPTMRLSMMQDTGGCRAVMPTVSEVRRLVTSYTRSNVKHKLHQHDDYILKPKASGYRGVHLIYRYYSDRKTTYNGLKIEMQIRTQLQHYWATAVETVGNFTSQALKASSGQIEWLRFFALMGSVMANLEDNPLVPGTPSSNRELKEELKHYAIKPSVVELLDAYRVTIQKLNEGNAHYFIVVLDAPNRFVNISGYPKGDFVRASADYLEKEESIRGTSKNAVLVSADSTALLERAYPNYFLDTHKFSEVLKKAIGPRTIRPNLFQPELF